MFALLMIDSLPISMNLKCDPQRALELRETYDYVQPGYHMNKKHWNTIIVHPSTDPDLIIAWIDHSFDLVCKKKRT
jgi:predicted DNA-binding protein (MmcQ/YjbR family)